MGRKLRASTGAGLVLAIAATWLGGCHRAPDSSAAAEQTDATQTDVAQAPAKANESVKTDTDRPKIAETKEIVEQAYIYAFPMIAAY